MTNDHREYALSDGDVCPPAIYKATSITKSQSSTLDYRDEDCALCGAPSPMFLPFALCARCTFHIHRYVGHMTALGNLTHHDEMEARVETVAEYRAARAADRQQRARVYYARRGEHIKIGTTISLTLRMSEIRPDELLAVEPGGRLLEQQRHAQFAEHRLGRREWFRDAPAIREHVAALTEKYGPPPPVPTF